MENYERFEHLLQHTAYSDLSADDQMVIKQFVSSEEEYEALRQVSLQAGDYFEKKIPLDPHLWKKISTTRRKWSAPEKVHWIKAPMPAYVTTLLLLGAGAGGWIAGSRSRPAEIATHIRFQVDTVYVTSRPDTIVKERVIYVDRAAHAPVMQTAVKTVRESPASKGVNMKEKEELEKLLVSGSM